MPKKNPPRGGFLPAAGRTRKRKRRQERERKRKRRRERERKRRREREREKNKDKKSTNIYSAGKRGESSAVCRCKAANTKKSEKRSGKRRHVVKNAAADNQDQQMRCRETAGKMPKQTNEIKKGERRHTGIRGRGKLHKKLRRLGYKHVAKQHGHRKPQSGGHVCARRSAEFSDSL